jgi:hypothetical protein
MKPIRNASLVLAIALFATVGFVGCSGSAQNQADANSFAQGSNPSSTSGRDFTGGRSAPRSESRYSQSSQPSSSGYSQSSQPSSSGYSQSSQESAPAPQPAAIVIPRGTELRISVDQTISSATAQAGDVFGATLLSPVRVGGQTIIPVNARLNGSVVEAKASGRLSGVSQLAVTLISVMIHRRSYNIRTDTLARSGSSHKKRDIIAIGGGSALGAIIGGIAGGGKGAAIGAAAGAGAGTAGAALTGKKNITLPAETTLIFRLTAPLTVQ